MELARLESAPLEPALLESRDELDRIAPAIRTLAADTLQTEDTTALPDYFLPRVADSRRPRVVVCYEHGQLVGVVYTEELLFAGRPTGWVSAATAWAAAWCSLRRSAKPKSSQPPAST